MDIWHEMDRHDELFLLSIGEPEENVLQLIVSDTGLVVDPEAGVSVPAREGAARYEIIFRRYVAYSVRNESFAVQDHAGVKQGRLVCLYETSNFQEFVRRSTEFWPAEDGPVRHFGLNCANHVFDIAAVAPPEVRKLQSKNGAA